MKRRWTLSAKLGAIGGALLTVALASLGLALWIVWQLDGGAAAVNEAGRMRMQTWRIAQTLATADRPRVDLLLAQFDRSIETLRNGDPSRPLFVPDDARSQAGLEAVQRDWRLLRKAWTAAVAPSGAEAAAQADVFVEQIERFVLAIESELARLTAILHVVQFVMVAMVIASALALLYSAYAFIFSPLSQLQAGLARVGAGDLGVRIPTASGAEFGELSEGFNRMTRTLQDLYQNLEAKVQEKTRRLEQERARLEALYETAAFIAQANTLEQLGHGFAVKVRQAARADASAVRWSDESNQRHLLLASDGLPEDLVSGEHCLTTGACLCGQARGEAATRVIRIARENDAPLLDHCRRGGFETVISVPVMLQERMLGELNLFYRTPTRLADEDRALLETLASHLAGAIESLRAGAQERATAVSDERGLLARELHDSIAQSLSFLKIQVGLLRQAIERSDAPRIERTLSELDTGVRDSLSDVRELLMHFRTRANTEDIAPALQTTLRKFEHQTGLTTHLTIEGEGMPLNPEVQVQVLHIVQEALSNVRKHARAQQVWVEVQESPQWRFEVRDDGCGFDEGAAPPDETHVGMRIMRERAERIGAGVEVTTVPGSGTCVLLTLPQRERLAA